MMDLTRTRFVLRRTAAALAFVAIAAGATSPARAQTATANEYQAIVAREKTARSAATPAAPAELRKIAAQYEQFVRKHPVSGYSDNALMQGASLYQLAFERSEEAADQTAAARLLTWLQREYPTSSLVKAARGAMSAAPATSTPAPPPAQAPTAAAAQPTPSSPQPTPQKPATPAANGASSVPTTVASSDAPPTPPLIAAAPAGAATPAAAPLAQVRAITRTALPKGERLTIELTREVAFAGDRVDNPDRVFFDFSNATIAAAVSDHLPAPAGGPIKTIRLGRPQPGTARVVLEVAGKPRFSAFPLYDPFRLVIDIEADTTPNAAASSPAASSSASVTTSQPSPASARLAAAPPSSVSAPAAAGSTTARATGTGTRDAARDAPKEGAPRDSARETPTAAGTTASAASASSAPAPPAPASTSHGEFSLARQLGLGVSRIVIDAGHGGHDPGAQANGITEAELVLDVALRLQSLLKNQPGFETVLTRSTDEFIALQERTAIANREAADLFLSIHANASRQPAARGVETYLLNFATNPQAEAVAARENAASGQTMGTLPEILKAIALNNKLAESRELATIVQTSMVRRLSAQNKTMRDLGVKQAPFVVLIGAQMPSVLAEISFVTNKADAGLLKQNAYRQRIAQALFDAILKYQASLKKVTTIATRDQER